MSKDELKEMHEAIKRIEMRVIRRLGSSGVADLNMIEDINYIKEMIEREMK